MHNGDLGLLRHANIDGHSVHRAVAVPARHILRERHLTVMPGAIVSEHDGADSMHLVLALPEWP